MNEIIKQDYLLNDNGELKHCGFSRKMLLKYDRKMIKANKLKIKEWDYYLIYNSDYALALTIADNSYMGMLSASIIDFKKPCEKTTSIITWFPMGKLNQNYNTKQNLNMPASSDVGDIYFKNKRCDFRFMHDDKNRNLYCYIKNFKGKQDLEANIILSAEPKENMVIATPFKENKKAFYYNQKIVGFKASGKIGIGENIIDFKPSNSFGLLDWGRGVWTYKNTWYWGAACGKLEDGNMFGFNIGYGFGDTSNATENMLFFNGKAHKLEDVTFNIPKFKNGKDNFLAPWTFSSNNKTFEMQFTPIINRHSDTNVLIIRSNQNQVFGKFTGYAILEDGTKIEIKNFLGFAEKVYNKW